MGTEDVEIDQAALWAMVHAQLRPKASDGSANGCLNRLTNERLGAARVLVDATTAHVRLERWPTAALGTLDAKHTRTHLFEDERPIVVVCVHRRLLLVDGNHRVAAWLAQLSAGAPSRLHGVLLVQLRRSEEAA